MIRERGSFEGEYYDVSYHIMDWKFVAFEGKPNYAWLKKYLPHLVILGENSTALKDISYRNDYSVKTFDSHKFAKWAKVNLKDKWYIHYTSTWCLCFSNPADAVLTKITWG